MPGVQSWTAGRVSASWNAARRYAPSSRATALGIIVALFAAITVLRWFFDRASEAVALLYVVPIALGALRFGRRGGITAAGIGVTAFVVLEALRSKGDIDLTGWVAPLLAMALMGGLVGHLSEVAAQREAEQRRQAKHIEELSDARRAAIETSDSVVQQVAAARWLLEAGQRQEALAALGDAVADGIARVNGRDEPLPDEMVPREILSDETLPDETLPDETLPDEPLPDEPVPDRPGSSSTHRQP